MLGPDLHLAAREKQRALEREPRAARGGHEALGDERHGAARFLAECRRIHGHVTPGTERKPLRGQGFLDERLGLRACSGFGGQEEHQHAGPAAQSQRWQVPGQVADERRLQRQRHARAVARFAVRGERATVAEVGQSGERQVQDARA